MLWVFWGGVQTRRRPTTPARMRKLKLETKKWNKQVQLFHDASLKDAKVNNEGVYWFNHFPLTLFEPCGRISADEYF